MTVETLEPRDWGQQSLASSEAWRFASLFAETLVGLDEDGQLQPVLAVAWNSNNRRTVWRFQLRPAVRFHDGSPMTAAAVARSLRRSGGSWEVGVSGDSVVIRTETPSADLPTRLARPDHSITFRAAGGGLVATGPFRVSGWEPVRRAAFSAHEDHWAGRPFLDAILVEFARPHPDQWIDIQVGASDMVEILPRQVRSAEERGFAVWASAPTELFALVFNPRETLAPSATIREAVARSVDRSAMHAVLLQRQGEVTASLVPGWLSGYSFLFDTERDLTLARQLAARASKPGPLRLLFDEAHPVAKVLAERIAVDAGDAGLEMTAVARSAPAGSSDWNLQIVILPIRLMDVGEVFSHLRRWLRLSASSLQSADASELYLQEKRLLEDFRIIPLFHVPQFYALRPGVKSWLGPGLGRTGRWHFERVWIEEQP